jgi:pyrroline-5-carboxylate reductase
MGSALLRGWLAGAPAAITVVEPGPSDGLNRLAGDGAITLLPDIEAVHAAGLTACVIAVKPQVLKTEAARLRPVAVAGALMLSIAAGTSLATLSRALGRNAQIVRAMPNLPGAIGRGISGLYAKRSLPPARRALAESLLAPLGQTVWVAREALIDSVTAVSGSGPAYVFLLVEALARAGIAQGLPAGLAERLARATVSGAGALLDADDRPAGALRRDVTSPGGTTEAALAVLMRDDALGALLERAVTAARERAEALGG